jgi:hypothetical protein
MNYRVSVPHYHLEGFLKGVPSYLSRDAVKYILCSMQPEVSWKTYWELSDGGTRKNFIMAMLWAEMYPTQAMVRNILMENKAMGPRHALLGPYKWWVQENLLKPILQRVFDELSLEDFQVLAKRNTPDRIIPFASKKQLVLLLGDKRVDKSNWLKGLIADRLKKGDAP